MPAYAGAAPPGSGAFVTFGARCDIITLLNYIRGRPSGSKSKSEVLKKTYRCKLGGEEVALPGTPDVEF